MKYCECGCGEELDFTSGRKNKKFKLGHHTRIKNDGAIARKGVSSWNKGIPRTDEEKKKISESIKVGKENSTYHHTSEHRRKMSESLKGNPVGNWVNKIMESRKNGDRYETWKQNISNTLKSKYRSGELVSPFYIDGRYKNNPLSHYNMYGGEFTDDIKYEIRKRDLWLCQLCGKERSTDVHHIDWNKLNNSVENLITLCRSCHAKHHHKSNTNVENERNLLKEIIKGKSV